MSDDEVKFTMFVILVLTIVILLIVTGHNAAVALGSL
jgi:hypothetical protein